MTLSPEFERQLSGFLRLAGKQAYANISLSDFMAWVRLAVPKLFPTLLRKIPDDPQEINGFLGLVAKSLHADFPLPALGLQAAAQVKPGRNDACDCGSGKKFKHCCGNQTMPPLFGRLNFLRYVLDAYPKSKLANVAASKASIDAVADTAYQWMREGQEVRAAALLEPFFAGGVALRARLAPLFNLLMDVWLNLGRNAKREALIETILQSGDRVLRSDALQRRTTMLADRGDHAAAWQAFKGARDLNPNDPALSFLEVTTLLSEGRTTEAQGRAQWWAAFLGKQRDPALEKLIEALRDIAEDPDSGMIKATKNTNAHWQRLHDLFLAAPVPTERHHFDLFLEKDEAGQTQQVAGAFVPDAKLRKLEAAWRKAFPQIKPNLTGVQHGDDSVWDSAAQWLDLLQANPSLWLSFDVLDDLVMAVDTVHAAGVQERLLLPMAERAVEQLRLTLASADGQPVQCHWVVWENRSALRPLAHLAFICSEAGAHNARKAQRFVELASWLVFELNPGDNHGLRADLSNALVRLARWDDVIALSLRYPGDMQPSLQLNALLAAFALEKSDGIEQDLKQAAKDYPAAMKMLLAAAPKPVKPDSDIGIAIGGKYEAWMYVRAMRPFWEQRHALDWARSVLVTKGKKAKPAAPEQQSLL